MSLVRGIGGRELAYFRLRQSSTTTERWALHPQDGVLRALRGACPRTSNPDRPTARRGSSSARVALLASANTGFLAPEPAHYIAADELVHHPPTDAASARCVLSQQLPGSAGTQVNRPKPPILAQLGSYPLTLLPGL
jgi:hypothetical protein